VEKAKADWKSTHSGRGQFIRNCKLYIKPEEGKAYYVINNRDGGNVDF